ncbi:MAG TPA: AMP-binding protein [Anaerolineales bacterium]|nr:AMP-binding protein [Anaerolineales bacterium]
MMDNLDTLPKNLLAAYEKYGDSKVAMRQKDLGIWRSYSWEDSYKQVESLCLGLMEIGLERNDKVCIIGDNDPQYFWAQLAIQAAGGVAVGIFTDSSPLEIKYIVDHSDSICVFAKDQEQCDKLLEIKDQLPRVIRVVYWEEKGLWNYQEPWLISFRELQAAGNKGNLEQPGLFRQSIMQGQADDLAVFCYTSGTTGVPKGAMITHANLIAGCDSAQQADPRLDSDEYLSFLPPAWITENVLGLTIHLRTGMLVNFPESPETVQENIREITPQAMLYSARLWENMMAMVQVKIADTSLINRFIYKLFMPVGYKVASIRYEKRTPVNVFLKLFYNIGKAALFQPLRDKLGLTRVKSAYSSGAALNPEVIRFFRAIGVNIKQLYGSTEAQVHTLHIGDDVRFETVGVPSPGQKIKISESGEILVSGGTVFQGYYKDIEGTRKAIIVDGNGQRWFCTGDAGHIDNDGHLIYLDRMKEMITLSSGEKYSPQFLEGQLKFSPYIRDVMTVGGEDKAFVTALINIDFENVGRWAEKRGLPYTTFVDLSQKNEVYALIRQDVERVNGTLPEAANITKFVLLHKEFDADEGELTRTRKLRRNLLYERYMDMIAAMYGEGDKILVKAAIKYQDGREGTIETEVHVASMEKKEV